MIYKVELIGGKYFLVIYDGETKVTQLQIERFISGNAAGTVRVQMSMQVSIPTEGIQAP